MFAFRLIVIVAFAARLFTGCCAGGCPAAAFHGVIGGEHPASCTCDCCCGETGCTHHKLCCVPFGETPVTPEHSPEDPCDCPGHSHHFCVGTHLFATAVERCELPALQVAIIERNCDEPELCFIAIRQQLEFVTNWRHSLLDQRQARAALQVYLL